MKETPLNKNVLNKQLRADEPKFKLWNSAGLMLSYWCSAACPCCYVYCSPQTGYPQYEMSAEMAIACWESMIDLAGDRAKVHLTGGEPFGNYDRLKTILQMAQERELFGLEKIETNAYWCTSENIIKERLEELKKLGLTKLQISTDIYHQEFVPIERVELAARLAKDILGEDGIQVRWRDFLDQPILVNELSSEEKDAAYIEEMKKRKERFLGRAAEKLAGLFPSRDYNDFAETTCGRSLLGAQHIHIDGAGHVFSGTCVGIIIGKVNLDEGETLKSLWLKTNLYNHPIFSILAEKGPVGLLEKARELGYQTKAGYASKCHICYDIRKFLYENEHFANALGPGLCYGISV